MSPIRIAPPDPTIKVLVDQNLTDDIPTSLRILAISAWPLAPKTRNQLVNIAYEDLGDALGACMGFDAEHRPNNWYDYAKWSSIEIGNLLGSLRAGRRGTRALAAGNRQVFFDLGTTAAALLFKNVELKDGIPSLPDAQWREILGQLQTVHPGPPITPGAALSEPGFLAFQAPTPPQSEEVASLLVLANRIHHSNLFMVRALDCWRQAISEPDPAQKLALALRADLLLVLHEQHHLNRLLALSFRYRFRGFFRPQILASQRAWRQWNSPDWLQRGEDWFMIFMTRNFGWMNLDSEKIRLRDYDALPAVPFDNWNQILQPFASATCWADLGYRMLFISRLFSRPERVPRLPSAMTSQDARDSLQHSLSLPQVPEVQFRTVDSDLNAMLTDLAVRFDTAIPEQEAVGTSLYEQTQSLRNPATRDEELSDLRSTVHNQLEFLTTSGLFDAEDRDAAARVFQQFKGPILLTLFARSLPHDYACPRGMRVLGLASSLFSTPVRRAGETAWFLFDVFASDATWSSGKGLESIAGLRYVHGKVRNLVKPLISIDPLEGWVPMNMEDVFGTALSFACPIFEMFDQFGIDATVVERDAYTKAWLVLAHLQGVPLSAITKEQDGRVRLLNYPEALAIAKTIRDRQQGTIPDLHGVRLMEAMSEGLQDAFLRPFAKRPIDLIRAIGSPDVNNLLLVPKGSATWQAIIAIAMRAFGRQSKIRRKPVRWLYNSQLAVFGWLFTRYLNKTGFGQPYRNAPGTAPVEKPEIRANCGCDLSTAKTPTPLREELTASGLNVRDYADWELELLVYG